MIDDVLIIGCGYIGTRVAVREIQDGKRVRALARSPEARRRLRAVGVESLPGDLDQPAALSSLRATATIVYYFAPPPSRGTRDPRMRAFLSTLGTETLPERVVLISTTGVYGDCAGRWINEGYPTNPEAERAHRRLDAEHALRAWSQTVAIPVVILRVPGIYGPDRLPVQRLKKRLPVLREQDSPWSNRVHAHDLVEACVAAADRRCAGGIYNISDGHPSTMTDFFNRVADALNLLRPPQVSREQAKKMLSAEMWSYLQESKRIDNTKMREVLGVTPRYPTLEAGLPSCVGAKYVP